MQPDATVFLFIDKAPSVFRSFLGGPLMMAVFIILGLTILLFSRPGVALWARFRPLPLVLLILGLLCSAAYFFGSEYPSYRRYSRRYDELLRIYEGNTYLVAQGQVHVLHEQAYGGHDDPDLVEVSGTRFEVSVSTTFGYTQTIAHGGALTEGSHVVVYYCLCPLDPSIPSPPTILRIDAITSQ